jgi:hypothetical protein
MKNAGLLQDGDDPTPEQFAEHIQRLNDMIVMWQTQGLKLWLQTDLSVTLTAGVNSYAIGPGGAVNMTRPMRILDNGYFLDTSNSRRPLLMMSRDEWMRLSQTTSPGAIASFFVDKQQLQMVVYVWLTPDATAATGTLHLLIQQQATFISSLTDQMNFPIEWLLAMQWGLADEICTGQPAEIVQRCSAKSSTYRMILEDWDVEDASTKFTPDPRQTQGQGSFR